MAEAMGNEPHTDPDFQATVTDFIDYTEHLPSDVRRSLALIEKLNADIAAAQHEVHELTRQWNAGPAPKNGATADEVALDLRARISYQKNLSSRYAAAAHAEATRINEEISRHQSLLEVTAVKLKALALPPSRDPTPPPVKLPVSPVATRTAGGRAARPSNHHGHSRRKRVIVPGEVLPPPNPDSPTPSDFSDWESPPPLIRSSPKLETRSRPTDKSARPKKEKAEKKEKLTLKPPKLPKAERKPGEGTNVHSSVAGISTSNALARLTPPPEGVSSGSEHAPWMRLTQYEMAKLRKRMKKNAVWSPSDTMIRRELTEAGRGPDNYRAAKQQAEETGSTFIDCDDLINRDPNRLLEIGEIALDTVKAKVLNKGMSLNVQKKEKKAQEQKQRAEQARLEAEQAAKNLHQLGESFKNLFDRPADEQIVLKPAVTVKKRKRESAVVSTEDSMLHSQLHSEIMVGPATTSKPPNPKKQRKQPSTTSTTPKPVLPAPTPAPAPVPAAAPVATSSVPANNNAATNTATTTTTTTIPLAAPAPSPVKEKTPIAQAPPSPAPRKETRRLSLVLKPPTEPTDMSAPPTSSRPHSRPSSRRASAGPPPEASTRERLRRKSATPGPLVPLQTPTTATLASRRTKRPPPGQVTSSQEGGNAISVGKRDKKPAKKSGKKGADATAAQKEGPVPEEEDIDPDEPRYCVCGDVSYGTMVMCENQDCEKEWFHLECVGLADIPSRRAKWWCPECSVKLGKTKAI